MSQELRGTEKGRLRRTRLSRKRTTRRVLGR